MTVLDPAAPTSPDAQTLRIALGNYPHVTAVKARASFGSVNADFVDVAPINRAFAPMARELAFDLSELALVTFLQAKACGKPLVLLPVAVAARFQETALLCRSDDASIAGPADLAGRRVGVRSYSQTTGVWLRGILMEDFGVQPEAVRWITFEGAHVAECEDPPWAERARPDGDLLAMLREGELDAVVVGNDRPDDPALRNVFPDPAAAADRFWSRHGFVPVNHVVVARRALVEARPDIVAAFLERLARSLANAARGVGARAILPVGIAALRPAVALALRYAEEQRLLPRPLAADEIWAGLPPELLSIGGGAAA